MIKHNKKINHNNNLVTEGVHMHLCGLRVKRKHVGIRHVSCKYQDDKPHRAV
jgi:hypothetical protein